MGSNRALVGGILRRHAVVAAITIAAIVSACSGAQPTQVTGIVTAIDGDLTTVSSFDVLADGRTWRFEPSPNGDFAFPLPHLRDHLRAGDPVIVEFSEADDTLIATKISDG